MRIIKNLFNASSTTIFMAITTLGVLSSCGSDETTTGGDNNPRGYLIVSVTPQNTISTRAAATTDPGTVTENTIANTVVAVVSGDGSTLADIDGSKSYSGNGGNLTLPAPGDTYDGLQVLVATNVPAEKFSSVTTKSQFKAVVLTAQEALYGANNHNVAGQADSYHIPMYGEGTVSTTNAERGLYRADVSVYHLVSKVTLKSLTVNFNSDQAVRNATFEPTEIFLANVPDQVFLLDASRVINTATTTLPTPPNFLSGEQSATGNPAYLSTGNLGSETSAIFYTTPNDKTADGEDGATFLVIKGNFTKDGTTTTGYYPVYLNYSTNDPSVVPDGGTAKVLSPNINYVVNVTITGKPSDSPTKPVDDSEARVKAVAVNFTDAMPVDYTIGLGEPAKVGDYYFNDGTWGPIVDSEITSSHYPIAVVFSSTTSEKDADYGWVHGYAVALTNYDLNMMWAVPTASGYGQQVQDNLITTLDAALSDLDGYTETKKIVALPDFSEANYPVAYAALNFADKVTQTADVTTGKVEKPYAAPAGSSGWYLGSIGQYYLVALNLGNNTLSSATSAWVNQSTTIWTLDASGECEAAVNSYLSAGQSSYIPTVTTINDGSQRTSMLWTSSESSATLCLMFRWFSDGIAIDGVRVKWDSSMMNLRPVIAF